MVDRRTNKLIVAMNVTEYFQKTVSKAVLNQSVDATEDAICYLVNLLTTFVDANKLYQDTPQGSHSTPLVQLYAEAAEVVSEVDRQRTMRRLGDISLFIAGLFSDSLRNKLVDIDYYISMGGSAYGYLSDALQGRERGTLHSSVFTELATNFTDFVDVLAEVGDQSELNSHTDLLRVYELWLKTNSKRAARQLREFGIYPQEFSESGRYH